MKNINFFLVKGNNNIKELVGNNEAYIITDKKSHKVKNVTCSNTFIIKKKENFYKAQYILELAENKMDLEELYRDIPEINIWSMSDMIGLDKYYFSDFEKNEIKEKCKLVVHNNLYGRLKYDDGLNVVCYLQSISNDINKDEKMSIYPEPIKNWGLHFFKGTSDEIGFFTLMSSYENNKLSSFLDKWKTLSIEDTSIKDLCEYVKKIFLPKKLQTELVCFLNNLEVNN